MPSIALPLHEPQFTPEKSQSHRYGDIIFLHVVSNKINLFQGSKCTLQKKCLTESLQKNQSVY